MMDHKIIISKKGKEYSIQHNPYLDINIIMTTIIDERGFGMYEYVDYICGNLSSLEDEEVLYYIEEYENRKENE